MEMGGGRVPGRADQADLLAAPHALADLHRDRAGLHVRVEQVDARAHLDDHVVANRLGDRRDRWSLGGRLVGQPVEGDHDGAIGSSDRRLLVAEIAAEVGWVSDPRAVLVIEEEEVDREPLWYS